MLGRLRQGPLGACPALVIFSSLSGTPQPGREFPGHAPKRRRRLEPSLTARFAPPAVPPDAAVLNRVQQENQRQIVGKLLHDLRNPVHSVRISMELFGRLARRNGDVDKLMERAAVYIEPAEAAVASLVAISERLSRYLAAASAPESTAVPVEEVLAEVTTLLRGSKRRLQVACTLPDDAALKIRADRIRVCHVLLHACLNNSAPAVAISTRLDGDRRVVLDAAFQAGENDDTARANALSAEEVQAIVETAGGTLVAATDAGLSMTFTRAADPPPA